MSAPFHDPHSARETVRNARRGGTLRAEQWNLIEDYLSELSSRGISNPQEVADRLERRGQIVAGIHDETFTFPPGGRRKHDSGVKHPEETR